MKIDKFRNLKNNVFSSKLVRVEDDDHDCVVIEEKLEDDFGPIEIPIGGLIEIVVTENEEKDGLVFTPVTSQHPKQLKDKEIISFNIPSDKTILRIGTEISFACNAKQEVSRMFFNKKVDSIKMAEIKCKAFEDVIEDRIKLAVNEWKGKKTSFEDEALESIHITLNA